MPSRSTPEIAFPESLNTPEFRAAWEGWLTERRTRYPREVLTPRILGSQMARCAAAPGGHAHAVAMLNQAADRGWKSVFADWVPNPATAKAVTAATDAIREPWQITKEVEQLRKARADLWRTDFESEAGRARYPQAWAKVVQINVQIRALEAQARPG